MHGKTSVALGASTTKRPAHRSVYETLRTQILFGDLIPGQPVTIQGLCQDLDAGMTPVREALRRLISDGALQMQGNRRVIVPELTARCLDQLEFMRQTLETELTRRAVPGVTQELLDELRLQDAALNLSISRGDVRGYLTHNHHFHSTLYETAQAPILAATVHRLWLRFGPSLRVVCGRYGTLNLPDKHIELVAALSQGNADAAAIALAEDIHQGMAQIRLALDDAASSLRFD